jgi:hypothetical protein
MKRKLERILFLRENSPFSFCWFDWSSNPRDHDYEHVISRKKWYKVIRRLILQALSKEGSGKFENFEILQMTVDYLRSLQHTDKGHGN